MKQTRCRVTLVLVFITTLSHAQQSNKILIAAASDLKFALDSIVAVFKKNNNGTVDITYGSSGKLFEQISNGAPFDIFFSADINYPKQLKEKGFATSEVYPYGVGRIVLWSKKIDPNKEGMKSLFSPSIKKVAIANPAHAPYGKRAEEALIYYKVLESVRGRLVYGENISQTAQFVTTGAADIGIVALSLALSPNMKNEGGKYYLIPESSHNALEQGAIITKNGKGNDMAKAFIEFMKSETSNSILVYFGFTKP
ncbi:MAG: molybdate ABC transporter substrate-binding protein [Chryseolinea sp.]